MRSSLLNKARREGQQAFADNKGRSNPYPRKDPRNYAFVTGWYIAYSRKFGGEPCTTVGNHVLEGLIGGHSNE